ncbi:sugar dehydrogenase [Chryseobacterium sp. Leaf404]|uniref:glucose 1-dehydrogenase n=1 Tax=unclassified Chryseobacterium TaxID=2593645 RepID=UPI0006F9C928|nr:MULTISPECIES: glucose 1-dehydrogenase [unclassified Chryseobacterium]KQT17062.1 sugar dehydrogenase [Chryseobacterium sp. Leaf404]
MQISLKNQIAIVTGASSGIGTGIAKSLAAAGATVIVNHSSEHSKDEAEEILKEIKNAGGDGMVFQCDVSKEDEVKTMFSKTISEYGTVDILINNAGLQKDAEFTEMTVEDWDKVMNVNLKGQFLCAREAIKEFLRRGIDLSKSVACGKIIHISSVHEVIPWAGHVNYAASKGGVKLLMQSLAQEYGAKKIRINSICPGAIQTPINEEAWGTEEAMNDLLKLIPYDRIGQPEDVGNLAVFLASDFADYITGASIFVDGGMTVLESFSKGG